jgi:long-chain acyl-CoA synthetase
MKSRNIAGVSAPYKVPTHVEFIDELPRTSVGKPMRNALRQQEKAKNNQS